MKDYCVAAAIACTLLAVQPGSAQAPYDTPEYRTSGFSAAAYLNGTAATFEGEDGMDSGGGVTLRLGYGVGRSLSFFVSGTGSSMESGDYTMGHFDLGARYLLLAPARLRPYLEAAVSGNAVSAEVFGYTLEMRGLGPSVGTGVEYALGRRAALDVGFLHTFGRYTEGRLNGGRWEQLEEGSVGGGSTRLNLGVVWRP